MRDNLPWISSIHDCLELNGMRCLYINHYENKPPFVHKKLFQRLSDIFHQESFSTILNAQSKLRTYGLLKRDIGIANYLTTIKNPGLRRSVTKFRLSNHKLNIEIGRHKNIPKELRFCPFCTRSVETEIHFLLECPVYTMARKEIENEIILNRPQFPFYTQTEQLQYLLSDEIIQHTSKYIKTAMDIREFLITRPKEYA